MTLAIMQPYIFPYLGYYQLVSAVDEFVFFDDVNYINKGWINRNQLLQQNRPLKFSVPLVEASQNKMINEIALYDYIGWRKSFLKTVEMNYKKAPYFQFVFKWLNDFLFLKDYLLINDLAAESIMSVAGLLELPTQFKYSSSLDYKSDANNGEQKVIKICKLLGGERYINPTNGRDLYNKEHFNASNIQLKFMNMQEINYLQFKAHQFVPHLSIIDVLMFNGQDQTTQLLNKFSFN